MENGVGGLVGTVGKIVTSPELREDFENIRDGALQGVENFKNIIEGKERAPFHD
jgi:hypothetical protein